MLDYSFVLLKKGGKKNVWSVDKENVYLTKHFSNKALNIHSANFLLIPQINILKQQHGF